MILFLVIIYYFITNKEAMTERNSDENVVFIIPSTSRNMNYKSLEETTLLKTLYESLKDKNITNFKFVIGFDDDDEFYLNNLEELKSRLPDNFFFHFLNNFDKSYVCIVNQLADLAIDKYNAEYLYVFSDDLNVYNLTFIDKFINYFKTQNNICLGWGIDERNPSICTHPFVHKKHVELLGFFYPKEIKNWYCDDWITQVYTKLNKVVKSDDVVFKNTLDSSFVARYEIANVERNKLDELVNFGADVLGQ